MPAPKNYHLLVVDDEDGPRQSIRMVFRNDYHIHLANSGEAALQLAGKHSFDLAILDIRMSGMSGIDLLKALKAIDPAIEVIILTAYETLETARQALRLGARDYIGKPFDVETIRSAVAGALMHRKVSLRLRETEKNLDRISTELEATLVREDMTKTMNQVYAGVLHDINNPLTIVSCFLDLVMDRVSQAPTMDEPHVLQTRDQLSTISRQVKICCEITRRHLDLLRRPAPSCSTSVNLVLADIRELIKVHPLIRRGDVGVNLLEEDVDVTLGGAELTQILLNLVINALQSSASGKGVEVSAHLQTNPVNLRSLQKGDNDLILHEDVIADTPPFVKIEVQDNGGGIAPEIMRDIFEPYFTTKSRDTGTGLGLSIVSRIVREARGGLHLHTVVGEGSTFTIFLPVSG